MLGQRFRYFCEQMRNKKTSKSLGMRLRDNKDLMVSFVSGAMFLATFLFTLMSSSIFSSPDYSDAALSLASCSIPHTVRTCLDVSTASAVTIGSGNVVPTDSGTFAYGTSSVNVKTNAPSFSLALSTNSSAATSQNLAHTTLGGGSSSTSIAGASGTFASRSTLGVDTWGFTTTASPTAASAIWAKVPVSTTPAVIVPSGTSNDVAGNTTNVYYGANISTGKTAGAYAGTVLYTITPAPFPAPTITSVTPAAGLTTGGTSITITGTNFYDVIGNYPSSPTDPTAPTLTGVVIGTAPSTAICTNIVVVSPTTITCTTPASPSGVGLKNITVTTEHGTATRASAFNYVTAPTVTRVVTATGAGVATNYTVKSNGEWPNAALGTARTTRTVAITGANFTTTAAGISITVGGTACASVTNTSATSQTCTIPNVAKTGNQVIVATTAYGTSSGTASVGVNAITYVAAPTVTSVVTAAGAGVTATYTVKSNGEWPNATLGTARTTRTVTVNGTGYTTTAAGISIAVGGTACAGVTNTSTVRQICTIPAVAKTGNQAIVVSTAYGSSTSTATAGTNAITYVAAPAISSITTTNSNVLLISPTLSTLINPGITVNGSNFGNNGGTTTLVAIGGTACAQSGSLTSTTARACTAPVKTVGAFGTVVHTAYGASNTYNALYILPIQLYSNAACPATRTVAYDARSNQVVFIRRIAGTTANGADGLCWMETNLRYGGDGNWSASWGWADDRYSATQAGGAGTVNPNDEYRPLAMTASGYFGGSEAGAYLVAGVANAGGQTTLNTSSFADTTVYNNNASYYGYLYNWCAAMGGQANACNSISSSGYDTSISICPAGWRLPTGGADPSASELGRLNTAVNSGITTSSNGLRNSFAGVYSGRYHGGILDLGVYGGFWSSTVFSGTDTRYMTFSANGVDPGMINAPKRQGVAVRCVR